MRSENPLFATSLKDPYKNISASDTEPLNPVIMRVSSEKALQTWRLMLLFITQICLGAYFLLVCIKLESRSTFTHLYIFLLCGAGHLAGLLFMWSYIHSPKSSGQKKISAWLTALLLLGSLVSQLLFALRMDLVTPNIKWYLAPIPFLACIVIVWIAFFILDPRWFMASMLPPKDVSGMYHRRTE